MSPTLNETNQGLFQTRIFILPLFNQGQTFEEQDIQHIPPPEL